MNALLNGNYESQQANPTTTTDSCSYVFDMMIKSKRKNYNTSKPFVTLDDLKFIRCRVTTSNSFLAYYNFIIIPSILSRLIFV